MSGEILTERRGRVLVITINRPDARSAVNLAVSRYLKATAPWISG